MAFGMLAGGMAGLMLGGLSLNNAARQNKIAEDTLEFNKRLATHGHQMAARDLEAAGISKNLAAGNPAQAGNVGAPQLRDPAEAMMKGLEAKMGLAQVGKTIAETQLAKEAARKTKAERIYVGKQSELAGARKDLTEAEAFEQHVKNGYAKALNAAQTQEAINKATASQYYTVKGRLETELQDLGLEGKELDNALTALTILIEDWEHQKHRDAGLPADTDTRVKTLLMLIQEYAEDAAKAGARINKAEDLLDQPIQRAPRANRIQGQPSHQNPGDSRK